MPKYMKKRYKVFAALHDDANQGWIWMPEEKGFKSRDYITLKLPTTGRKITCTCRLIDDNFLTYYNQPPRINIQEPNSALVISAYYRDMLDGLKTNESYDFEINKVWKFNYARKVKAILQHPDNGIKIAAWLAIISIIVSLIGAIGLQNIGSFFKWIAAVIKSLATNFKL